MKKSVMMIPLLFIAVIGMVFFGRRYSAAQNEELDVNQMTVSESGEKNEKSIGSINDELRETPLKDRSKGSLEIYESNSEHLSFYDYLDYISLKNEGVTLAYYGDIDTDEAWVNEITEEMTHSVSEEFTLSDHTYPDYDTYELYIEQTAQAVMVEKPDVIVYGLPALPDQKRDMGLAETEEYMGYILDRLSTLKNTKIVLLEPHPVPAQIDQLNSRSLDYRSYLSRMKSVSEEYELTLIPLHSNFTDEALDGSLERYYDQSDKLNEEGTQQVVSVLDALLNEEM